jgi:hypothetical protein
MFARLFVYENKALLFHGGMFYGNSHEKIIEMIKLRYSTHKEDSIIIENDVEKSVAAEIIEFYRGDEDLGICLFQKFSNYVKKQIDEYVQNRLEEEESEESETVEEIVKGNSTLKN